GVARRARDGVESGRRAACREIAARHGARSRRRAPGARDLRSVARRARPARSGRRAASCGGDRSPGRAPAPAMSTIRELESRVGEEVGLSPWVDITQERIDTFARAIEDF